MAKRTPPTETTGTFSLPGGVKVRIPPKGKKILGWFAVLVILVVGGSWLIKNYVAPSWAEITAASQESAFAELRSIENEHRDRHYAEEPALDVDLEDDGEFFTVKKFASDGCWSATLSHGFGDYSTHFWILKDGEVLVEPYRASIEEAPVIPYALLASIGSESARLRAQPRWPSCPRAQHGNWQSFCYEPTSHPGRYRVQRWRDAGGGWEEQVWWFADGCGLKMAENFVHGRTQVLGWLCCVPH